MTASDATTGFCAALVDEWARSGIAEAVVAPGSRSTPLALALARDGRLRLHVVLDERSAAFLALGIGMASGRPAVLLCTSGTAAASFHPAVVEAHHARVPMLVCTADRPPEMHDSGAGQTIDQEHLYGTAVRWFCAPGPPEEVPGIAAVWRSLASRSVAAATGPPAGPVHLNLAFRDPLLPTGALPISAMGRPGGRPWTVSTAASPAPDDATIDRLVSMVAAVPRGLLVAGWGAGATAEAAERFAHAAGWPVVADTISGLRSGPQAVGTYDALLRSARFAEEHRPDLVIRIGAPLTSKVATAWLDASIPQILVDPDGAWLDPQRAATERIVAGAERLLTLLSERLERDSAVAPSPTGWLGDWLAADAAARAAIDGVLDADDVPFEGRVARDVFAALPEGAALLVASSMPVRDLEWFAAPRSGVRVHANRGANGIDGLVSTTIGVAAGGAAPTIALLGDIALLHDTNGLLGAAARGVDAVFVVLDNDGGGIFSFLPQSELCSEREFETLFATPHGVDLVAVAAAHGVRAERVTDAGSVVPSTLEAIAAGGVHVLVVPTDRSTTVDRHNAVWEAVAATVAP